MKKILKILTGLTISLTYFSIFLLPGIVQAASSSYSFTLDHRVVDGSLSGKYHTLTKGNVYLTGSQYVYSTDKGYAKTPSKISYELRNKTTNNGFGYFAKAVSSRSGIYPTQISKTKFSKTVGGGNKYYLIIWKASDDGNNVKGNGKLSN